MLAKRLYIPVQYNQRLRLLKFMFLIFYRCVCHVKVSYGWLIFQRKKTTDFLKESFLIKIHTKIDTRVAMNEKGMWVRPVGWLLEWTGKHAAVRQ